MRTLQDLVSTQSDRTPEATALVMQRDSLSYGALETASNRIAHLLLDLGCGKGDRVCLFLPKGIEAIAGMIGVLKAGAVYVPVDLDSPAQRVRRVVAACEPAVVLAEPRAARLLDEVLQVGAGGGPPPRIVNLRDDDPGLQGLPVAAGAADWRSMPAIRPPLRTADTDPAHILFTSGSTGNPKGVIITHRNVIAFLDWACDYFRIRPGERLSGHPPLHFDLSTFDIYGSLSRGATLHLVPPSMNLLAPKLAQFMRDAALDQWFSVPSILTYMANFNVVRQGDFPHLKRLLWCGEVLPTRTLMYWMERLPHVQFTNLYGPTEATIASSHYTVPAPPASEQQAVPIGTPCGGEELLVLDDSLQRVAPGVIGNLYIRGAGLSPGYWRDPEQTRAAFLTDPSGSTSAPERDRLYRTGDLAWLDENGVCHFVGRADNQIKSRGYRIEPGEIEAALDALGCLRECAVVGVATGGFENWAICCAYVAADGTTVTPAALRHELTRHLPSYMLPNHWQDYPALPKNANGKIDRPRLREHFGALLEQRAQAVEP
jgi:amino acid adenylation domain-containing protein